MPFYIACRKMHAACSTIAEYTQQIGRSNSCAAPPPPPSQAGVPEVAPGRVVDRGSVAWCKHHVFGWEYLK